MRTTEDIYMLSNQRVISIEVLVHNGPGFPKIHAGLRCPLVGPHLESDNCFTLVHLFFGEVAFVRLGVLSPDTFPFIPELGSGTR